MLATNVETIDDCSDTRLTLVVQLYNRKVIVWNERKSEKEGQTKIKVICHLLESRINASELAKQTFHHCF